MLVSQVIICKNGYRRDEHLVVKGDRTFFTNKETSVDKKHNETLICQMVDFLRYNIYVKIGNHFFQQCTGYPQQLYLALKLNLKAVNTLMSEILAFPASLDLYISFDSLLVCFHCLMGVWQ